MSQITNNRVASHCHSNSWSATLKTPKAAGHKPSSRAVGPAARPGLTAIYPGSFDPITNGHLDIISRGSRLFGRILVAVLTNSDKQPYFGLEERVEMLRETTRRWKNVEVDTFDGLLVHYAMRRKADVIVRGIRAISDYEYECQMALMNRRLEPRLETLFMVPGEAHSFLSSRLVREIFHLGGSIKGLVPPVVEKKFRAKKRD